MKKIKNGKEDWLQAYAEWRNATTVEGASPAQLFYGPQVHSGVLPELHREVNVARMAVERRSQEENKRFKRVTRQEAQTAEQR